MAVLRYEKSDHIAHITFTRPGALNAFNDELNDELGRALVDFRDDPEAFVAIVAGEGRAFSVGADVKEMSSRDQAAGEHTTLNSPLAVGLWKPLIAAIDGYALGGGLKFAMECDLRVATERSRLGIVETRTGNLGSHYFLTLARLMPASDVLHLLVTGSHIGAEQAHRAHLVHQVVPDRQALMKRSLELAEEIKLCAPLAIQAAKQVLHASFEQPPAEAIRLFEELRRALTETEDAKEGIRALAEKRKPVWRIR